MKSSGFTLIELLMVIAIIGVLSAVVFATLNSSRNQASDSSKISGVQAVAKGMELARNPLTGYFPTYSNTAAATIGLRGYVEPWPGGVEYINNVADNQLYCVYAAMADTREGAYFAASGAGSGFRATLPNLGDCDRD